VLRAVLVMGSAATAACGGESGSDTLGRERSEQVRDAAVAAGLPHDVADVLALAARGTTAAYRITYPGSDGGTIVVSQEPPNQRLDVVTGDIIVQSHVIRDGVGYECTARSTPPRQDEPLECRRADAATDAPGAFTTEALAAFTEQLAESADRFDLAVEERPIAGTTATCLVAAPKAGTPIDGKGPGVDSLCLSPEGAQLLTDAGGERIVADTYSTEVPEGTFDV